MAWSERRHRRKRSPIARKLAEVWSLGAKMAATDEHFRYFPLPKFGHRTNSFIDFFFC